MTDQERKAMEMALEALEDSMYPQKKQFDAIVGLRQALAQPEQTRRVCNTCDGTGMAKGLHNWKGGGKRNQPCWACHEVADEKKEPALGDADPRSLLGRSNNFTKEIENRLCDIERRLAAADTQHALAQPEQEPVWCGCGDGIVANDEAMCGVCVMRLKDQIKRLKVQPEQEPLCWLKETGSIGGGYEQTAWGDTSGFPVFTAPPSKPEQEPVAWEKSYDIACALLRQAHDILATTQYPIKRPWVSLTDEEIDYIWGVTPPDYENFFEFPRAIEAALRSKNT